MVTESMMYWITRLDNFCIIGTLSIVLGIISCIFFGIGWSIYIAGWRDDDKELAKKFRNISFASIIPVVIGALICTFVPTTKEYCAIKVIPAIANNSDVQNIGKDLKTLAEKWVEKQIKELDNADK